MVLNCIIVVEDFVWFSAGHRAMTGLGLTSSHPSEQLLKRRPRQSQTWSCKGLAQFRRNSAFEAFRGPTLDLEEARKRDAQWGTGRKFGHRAAFCIPLIVPHSIAYNIFERHTCHSCQYCMEIDFFRVTTRKFGTMCLPVKTPVVGCGCA